MPCEHFKQRVTKFFFFFVVTGSSAWGTLLNRGLSGNATGMQRALIEATNALQNICNSVACCANTSKNTGKHALFSNCLLSSSRLFDRSLPLEMLHRCNC